LQGKLVRVLQEGQFERIGEMRTRKVNVRVIAATNRDLNLEVRQKRFREDLFFRLNVFPIESVPLRERKDDVALLAAHFLRLASRKLKVGDLRLTEGDVRRLMRYPWPGNVRELQNVIEHAAILAQHGRIRIELPGVGDSETDERNAGGEPPSLLTDGERRDRDRANIVAALQACGGKVSGPGGAAELLNVRPTTLASRMKALRIPKMRTHSDNTRDYARPS
jgi:transcriptional regulator with GAF, ATPase, and Fis domain